MTATSERIGGESVTTTSAVDEAVSKSFDTCEVRADSPAKAATKGVRRKKILAVASGGGHWIQLLRMTPAFSEHELVYMTTLASYRPQVEGHHFHVVPDANRWNKFALLVMAIRIAWIVFREKPAVIISTGAAPGFFALRIGKMLGATTIWVDSIANAQKMSMSGQSIGKHADLWLTQWPHLARPDGPHFFGSVL